MKTSPFLGILIIIISDVSILYLIIYGYRTIVLSEFISFCRGSS